MDVFTEAAGLIESPLRIVFSCINLPAKNAAHDAEITIPEINKAAPTITITYPLCNTSLKILIILYI
jgi:hypothetical protein